MVCAERCGATWHLPATPTEVRDVCGAGDTVFAVQAVEIVTGKSLREACWVAMWGRREDRWGRWEWQRSRELQCVTTTIREFARSCPE